MTEVPTKRTKRALPVQETLPVRRAIDVDEMEVETQKLNEIAKLLVLHESLSEEDKNARIARAYDLYEDLAPADGLEGMLAVQMVGTHHAILECLRRAAFAGPSYGDREMNLQYAEKLMILYIKQVTALDKHRGKGQQNVTVKHVHVADGGQAIVGHVETGTSKKSNALDAGAIEHREELAVDLGAQNHKSGHRRSIKE